MQITSTDKVAGSTCHPHPPSQPPVTPRTPRTPRRSGLESLHTRVNINDTACPVDGCNMPRNDVIVATPRGQPQKRSPPSCVFDEDEEAAGCKADYDGEDARAASASKRMRSANVEVY